MGRILSGVQPTGNLHLGNYLGAIRQWVAMQHQHESLFCIVDLHAITVPQDPESLRKATRAVAAAYIACGIDVGHSSIFVQSHVKQHTELAWILGCQTPLGWLNRMTQFKEKAGKHKDQASLGLYSYPVLMAADILLYQSTHVPVGEDQKQHLELARDIAGAFNRNTNTETFPLPEPLILGEATRVMSLRDGTSKMSKSDPSEQSRIHLMDDAETIRHKIKKAKSDMEPGISYDPEKRPEVANLLNIYCAVTSTTRDAAVAQFEGKGFADFKGALADALVDHLTPIRTQWIALLEDQTHLDQVLAKGAEHAAGIAEGTMKQVRELVGFV
jgi:tryptophanyl-tRNA synthetase